MYLNFSFSNLIALADLSYIIPPEYLGIVAGMLTTIAFIPQLIKTWRSKSADDVSFVMFTLFITGVFLWAVYGWEIKAIPVIIANIITLILASLILFLKLFFEYNTKK